MAAEDAWRVRDREPYLAAVQDYMAKGTDNLAVSDPKWQRTHGTTQDFPSTANAFTSFFPEALGADDELYHMSKIMEEEGNKLFRFQESSLQEDQRYQYESEEYPWLLMAAYYEVTDVNFGEFDSILMQLPSGTPPGHYMVFWDWEGYNDCMDVELRLEEVEHVNGLGSTDFVYQRIEHCQYTDRKRLITSCAAAAPTVDQCVEELKDWDETERVGINVVPLSYPSIVPDFLLEGDSLANTPFDDPMCGAGTALQVDGTATQSATEWEAAWMAKTTMVEATQCSRALFTRSDLKAAIIECSPKVCLGIAESAENPGTYVGCSSTEAGDGWTAFLKNAGALGSGPTDSYADDLKAMEGTWAPVATISFQPPDASVSLPTGTYADVGEMFGAKASGLEYGWLHCPHTEFYSSPDVSPATTESTSARWFFEPCNCDLGIGPNDHAGGWTLDAPAPCVRNKWEMAVDNGWYRLSGKISPDGDQLNNRGCGFEGTKLLPDYEGGYDQGYVNYMRVNDGRLTIDDLGHKDCCKINVCHGLATMVIEKFNEDSPLPPPAWFPSSDDPWWQLELDRPRAIGQVAFRQPNNNDECQASWLWHEGGYCFEPRDSVVGVPCGYEDNIGAIVGVTNSSCQGASCSGGVECGRITKTPMYRGQVLGVSHSIPIPVYMDNLNTVDCAGKIGKYVYVQLPGQDRIIYGNITVHLHRPAAETAEDQFLCYGVHSPEFSEANPEYHTTNDPEDPIFYATGLVRERDLVVLPPLVQDTVTEEPYLFNGQCLPCDVYQSNLNPEENVPNQWPWADKCVPCE
jgi:hypothetical protein